MLRNEFCNKAPICNKIALSKMILMSSGCPKTASCSDFIEKREKIKEVVLPLTICCASEKCHRDSREKVKDECIDCMDLKLGVGYKHRKIEFQLRCLREFCMHDDKEKINKSCLDCENVRVFSTDRQTWTLYRGGKDIKGNNFARR